MIIALTSGLQACKPDVKVTQPHFFDIRGYFANDSAKLTHLNPFVNKTAWHNGKAETHKVHVRNWGTEFSLFTGSDINKPAWRDSYNVVDNDTLLKYTARQPELKTRQIIIKRSHDTVTGITIFNRTENFLYINKEKLFYKPGSGYSIEKTQQVRFMGVNSYKIKGILLH